MRLLFASSSGSGHFLPLVPWIEAAQSRGHDVLVLGPDGLADRAARFPFVAAAEPDPDATGRLWGQVSALPPEEARPFVMREIFTRHSSGAMLGPAREVVADFQPHALLREPMEFGSAVAALEAEVPQVRVSIGLARIEERFLGQAAPALEDFRAGATEALAGTPYVTAFPASYDPHPLRQVRYRLSAAPRARAHEDVPLVYVTFGTEAPKMEPMAPVFEHALAALADLPVRVLLTVGHDFDTARLGSVPANTQVQAWADQGEVLARAALVVHHGGSGTTLGALAAGCPQVVLPLFADQPANARAVAETGVGLSLREEGGALFRAVTADVVAPLRAAVVAALADDRLSTRAAEVAAEVAALPTLDEVAPDVIPGW